MNKEQKTIKIAKGIKIVKSIFDKEGGVFTFKTPKDCDLIILCGNKGGGYEPYRCLLPHQVYLKDIKEAFDKEGYEVIYVLPVNSKNSLAIAYNGEYGKNRWEK